MSDASETAETADLVLDQRRVSRILEAVDAGDAGRLGGELEGLHPADIADLLEQISDSERAAFVGLWDGAGVGEVLSELDEGLREEVIGALDPAALSAAVRDLETDDVVDLVEDLEAAQRASILGALKPRDRYAVEQSLNYPEGTAGRLMQRDVVSAPEHWTVGEMIDYLRAAEDLPEQFYHVTLVDPRMVPVANVTLGRMLSARRAVALRDIGEASLMTIPVDQSVEEVAYTFNQYHLISAPVVDAGGRLVGTVTIDDAMAVLSEENEEDLLLLAGVSEGSVSDSVMDTVRARILWLAVNLVTAILASVVIAQFDAALSRFVALAVLMPVVASMGGNAGTQSLTVAVRALATRDLTASNMWRVIRREGLVGLLNGLAFAATMGIVSVIWFGEPMIGAVMAVAMVLTLVAAAVGGVMVPIALDRLKVDPAVASGPFVTTITDVVGFFVFLGIATLVLL